MEWAGLNQGVEGEAWLFLALGAEEVETSLAQECLSKTNKTIESKIVIKELQN